MSQRSRVKSKIIIQYDVVLQSKGVTFRWINYYPAVEETNELMRVLRDYGLYRDEHKDFCEEMQ